LRAATKFDCQHLHRRQNRGVTAQKLDQGKRLSHWARLASIEFDQRTTFKPGLDQSFVHGRARSGANQFADAWAS